VGLFFKALSRWSRVIILITDPVRSLLKADTMTLMIIPVASGPVPSIPLELKSENGLIKVSEVSW